MTTLQSTSQINFGLSPIIDYSVPTVNSTYTLPTGSNIKAGQRVVVANGGANSGSYPIISVNASDATLVRSVYPQTDAEFFCTQDNPTNQAHWIARGVAMSDWIAFTPVITNLILNTGSGFVTPAGKWRRNGPNVIYRVAFVNGSGGSASGGVIGFVVPASLVIDTARLDTGLTGVDTLGAATSYVSSFGTNYDRTLSVQLNSTTSVGVAKPGTGSYVNGTDLLANSQFSIVADVPIVGWSVSRG